jgi:fibronectin-binding autotransporter adhesin
MRPAFSHVGMGMSVLSILIALFAFESLAFAQATSTSKRKSLQQVTQPAGPLTTDVWTGAVSADWSNASNWSSGSPSGQNVLINLTTAATDDDFSVSVGTLTLSNKGDSVTVLNGINLSVGGNITNNGTITLDSGATLSLPAITVSNTGGTISANGSNSTLQMNSTTIDGGTVTLKGASILQMNSSTIQGGTLNNSATGTIEIVAPVQYSDSTLGGTLNNPAGGVINIAYNAGLALESGSYNNGGTIEMNAAVCTEGNCPNSGIFVNGANVTLTGGGTVTMNNNDGYASGPWGNLIVEGCWVSGNCGASPDTLTNKETIEGAGYIGFGGLKVVNSGTIKANLSAGLIINTPYGDSGGKLTNTGTLEASAGGSLIMASGTLTNFSGKKLTGGTYIVDGTSAASTMKLSLGSNSGGEIVNNAANIILNGSNTDVSFVDANGNYLLSALAANSTATSSLTIEKDYNFTTLGNFTNKGTLAVGSGSKFDVNGNLTNFSGTTLKGGAYNLTGTLQFNGANIVTTAANITLNGASSQITNQFGGNGLANLAVAASTGAFTLAGGRNFTTAGNFNNLGTLSIGSGSAFSVGGTLAQIRGSALSGGTFVLGGNLNVGSGISITTNASALTLEGGTIQSGTANALAGLNTNSGTLGLANDVNFTTAGNFNNTGTLAMNEGSTFKVTGTLAQISGSTLASGSFVLGGTLEVGGGISIATNAANLTLEGGTIQSGTANALAGLNSNTGTLAVANSSGFTAGGDFLNSGALDVNSGSTFTVTGTNTYTQSAGTTTVDGTLVGNVAVTGDTLLGAGTLKNNVTVGPGTLSVGDAGKAGLLKIAGTYTQLSTGTVNFDIGGTRVGTQYSRLEVTGAASLSGTLTSNLINGFTPEVGATFTLLSASNVSGMFSTQYIVINESEYFAVSYTSKGVVLTVDSGVPPA